MKKVFLIVAIILSAYIVLPKTAEASCVITTDQEKFDRAELVAIGEIRLLMSNNKPLFKFTKIFKNNDAPEYNSVYIFNHSTIDTPNDVPWKTNQSYLMYLHTVTTDDSEYGKGYYYTDICDGTREFNDDLTASEIAVIGENIAGLPLPPEPGLGLTNTVTPSSPATTFSIEDFYPSYYNDETENWPKVSIYYLVGLIIAGLFLLVLVVQQGHHVGTPEIARQYGRWAIAVLVVMVVVGFFLLFRPFSLNYSLHNLPLYALFTPAAAATLGCADVGASISSLITLGGMAGLIIIALISVWLLLFPDRLNERPLAAPILITIYIFLALLPIVAAGIDASIPSSC